MTPKQAEAIISKWRDLRKKFAVDERTGQIDLFSLIDTSPQSDAQSSVKND